MLTRPMSWGSVKHWSHCSEGYVSLQPTWTFGRLFFSTTQWFSAGVYFLIYYIVGTFSSLHVSRAVRPQRGPCRQSAKSASVACTATTTRERRVQPLPHPELPAVQRSSEMQKSEDWTRDRRSMARGPRFIQKGWPSIPKQLKHSPQGPGWIGTPFIKPWAFSLLFERLLLWINVGTPFKMDCFSQPVRAFHPKRAAAPCFRHVQILFARHVPHPIDIN